jgi:hypothetical protein
MTYSGSTAINGRNVIAGALRKPVNYGCLRDPTAYVFNGLAFKQADETLPTSVLSIKVALSDNP